MRLINRDFFKAAVFYFALYFFHFSVLRICALHYSIYFLYVVFIFVLAALFTMLAFKIYQEEVLRFAKHQSLGHFLIGICKEFFITLPIQVYDLTMQSLLAKIKTSR